MICDIEKTIKYRRYKYLRGPFIIVFYHRNDRENFNLYSNLKSWENRYMDIPILRFYYNSFIKTYPDEGVLNQNSLLIIEEHQQNIIYNNPTSLIIEKILIDVRTKRLDYLRKNNNEYIKQSRITMKCWAVNSHCMKKSEYKKFLSMDAESLYKFPNDTSSLGGTKFKNIKSKTKKLTNAEKCLEKTPILNKKRINVKPKTKSIYEDCSFRAIKFNSRSTSPCLITHTSIPRIKKLNQIIPNMFDRELKSHKINEQTFNKFPLVGKTQYLNSDYFKPYMSNNTYKESENSKLLDKPFLQEYNSKTAFSSMTYSKLNQNDNQFSQLARNKINKNHIISSKNFNLTRSPGIIYNNRNISSCQPNINLSNTENLNSLRQSVIISNPNLKNSLH